MRMPFGKHIGVEIEDLPDGYLLWLYEQAEIKSPYLKRCIEEEYHARFGGGPKQEHFWGDDFRNWEQWPGSAASAPGAGGLEKLARENPKLFAELVDAGYQKLALRRHPDQGGTVEAMQELNGFIAKLRETLRSKV